MRAVPACRITLIAPSDRRIARHPRRRVICSGPQWPTVNGVGPSLVSWIGERVQDATATRSKAGAIPRLGFGADRRHARRLHPGPKWLAGRSTANVNIPGVLLPAAAGREKYREVGRSDLTDEPATISLQRFTAPRRCHVNPLDSVRRFRLAIARNSIDSHESRLSRKELFTGHALTNAIV